MKILAGRQQRDHRRARRHRLSGQGQHVSHPRVGRRGDPALREPPLSHLHGGARGGNGRPLRLDLTLATHRRPRLRQRRRQAGDLRLGGAEIGAHLVNALFRGVALRQQGLTARQVGGGAHQGRVRVREIGLRLLDFGWFGGFQQIGELFLRLLELSRRLVPGCLVVGVILAEQRRAGRDPVPAGDVDRSEQPRLGRPDVDEIGLGVTLPKDWRYTVCLPPPEASAADDGQQNDRDDHPSSHVVVFLRKFRPARRSCDDSYFSTY